ncbi:protein-L-isoaspartate(D-aspartate) O-methyltransferase [Aliikangiella coralliicola]|uniref:Protein-L-isoaspartate O-methyltransferase n=2 Tax=Aliikangiella coralliicola TaxID=2592383 RepID=A0A545UI07_9GAMM|nr:protein-L-isoaspartate(D-aspartate) O-methyltransferase [Aliikangiella coralliicola]
MLEKIRRDAILTSAETGRRVLDKKVMQAMSDVARHKFVSEAYAEYSYENRPLPIGQGQTISQPFIVALMTDFLELEKTHKVLEVGTGSGYQAAVLAVLSGQVYSIEIIPELGKSAASRLKELGYGNVEVTIGDGYRGRPELAPFDAIIVTAAADKIPPPLIEQLKPGGRMMIPVGPQHKVQQLTLVEKNSQGEISVREVLPVSFVPLTGEH